MQEARLEPAGVPARIYDPGGTPGMLLLGHGGGHGKDSPRFAALCRRFAAETGLAVLCIDAVDHGERRPTGAVGPGIPPRWHSSTIEQMAGNWHAASAELARFGPALAYVGFSMGSIFGIAIVVQIPTIRSAVFVVGGIPSGGGIDDPPLEPMLMSAAGQLGDRDVLMVNMSDDDVMPVEGVHRLFDAVPGRRKRVTFWPGGHDEWPDEAIAVSVAFINRTLRPDGSSG